MKKIAIFDLDGTLLNTLNDLAAACNYALREHGLLEHPAEAYKQFVGNGADLLIRRILPASRQNEQQLHQSLKEMFSAYYSAHAKDLTRPYDGIIKMLDKLSEKGITLTVLSNKPHIFTSVLVPQYFGDRFALAYGQREGYPAKPDQALVEEILRQTGFAKEECVYFGDSGVDMQTAKNGGVQAVGVLWGFREREELMENGADKCVECPMEILQIFA